MTKTDVKIHADDHSAVRHYVVTT